MDEKKFNLYRDAIVNQYPNATDIREMTGGSQHNILTATVGANERVFKFNDEDIVLKNAKVSYLYGVRNIPVPKITPREYGDLHFEDYVKISGPTLYDAIQMGMDIEQVKAVYRDVVKMFVKMDRVYPEMLGYDKINFAPRIAQKQLATTHGYIPSWIFASVIAAANMCSNKNKAVYHFDPNPKNIVVSDDGKLKSFLDLDSVGICTQDFAFAMLGARYQQLGLDIKDLFKYYNTLSSIKLNYHNIEKMARMRKAMFKTIKPKSR